RLFRRVRPCWPHLGIRFLLHLVSTPVALLMPLPLMIAVDSALGAQPLPGFRESILPALSGRSPAAVLVLAVCLGLAMGLLEQLYKVGSSVLGTLVNVAMSEIRQASYRPWMLTKVVAMVFLGLAGCGGGLTTYPVQGQVVFKGGRPVTSGGRIEFQSTSDPQ